MIAPPEWARPDEVSEHGAALLCAFVSRAHWEHFRATGEMRLPQTARDQQRRAERLKADPLYAARRPLSITASRRRTALKAAQRKHADAAKWQPWKCPPLAADIEKKRAELEDAEVTRALFDELHRTDGCRLPGDVKAELPAPATPKRSSNM